MANESLYAPVPYGLGESAPDLSAITFNAANQLTAATGDALSRMPRPQAAPQNASPFWYNPGTKQYIVGGRIVDSDNETGLADAFFNRDPNAQYAPPDASWQSLDSGSFSQHIQKIVDPTVGRSLMRNFGISVDNAQLLAGYGLQFLGAEETGKGIVDQQIQDLSKTQVYNRQWSDIGSDQYGVKRGVVDWFVANLGQFGESFIESVVVGALGAVGGAALGGGPNPITAVGGALTTLAGRQAVKQAALAAARKYSKGEALDAAESKLLQEMAGLSAAAAITDSTLYASATRGLIPGAVFRAETEALGAGLATRAGLNQARAGGAATALFANNYRTGVSDIYGETVDAGAPNRVDAATMGFLYAAAESIPELLLGLRIFGGIGKANPLSDAAGEAAKGALARFGSRAGKVTTGGIVGGVTEGSTEAFQEALLLAANPMVDMNSPEGIKRLQNSFAAGFGIGAPLGAGANLFKRNRAEAVNSDDPANLLDPVAPTEPTDGGFEVMPPPPPPTPALPGGAATPLLPPPYSVGSVPNTAVVDSQGNVAMPNAGSAPVTLNSASFMPAAQGGQGVLNVFDTGAQLTAGELASRTLPQQGQQTDTPPPPLGISQQLGMSPQPSDPRQGALQFSGPAPYITDPSRPPAFNTQLSSQLSPLQQQMRASQLQAEFDAAMQQRALSEQEVRDQAFAPASYQAALYDIANALLDGETLNSQELALLDTPEGQNILGVAQQQRLFPPYSSMPMTQGEPRRQRQLNLFRGKVKMPEQPKGAEAAAKKQNKLMRALQRQYDKLVNQQALPLTPAESLRRGQLPLFTQQGEPSVAALRSAGQTTPVPTPTVQQGVSQAAPTNRLVTAATVAKQKRQTAASSLRKGTPAPKETKTEYRVTFEGKPATLTIIRDTANPEQVAGVVVKTDGARLAELNLGGQGTVSDEKLLQNLRDTDVIDTPKPPTPPKGTDKLKRGKKTEGKNAVQKQSTTSVADQKQTKGSQAVRGGNNVNDVQQTSTTGETKSGQGKEDSADNQTKTEVRVTPATKVDTSYASPQEAWDDMKPEGFPALDDIATMTSKDVDFSANKELVARWKKAHADGTATMALAEEISDELTLTARQQIDLSIEQMRSADPDVFKEGAWSVVYYAFFDTNENNVRRHAPVAQEFLANTDFTPSQRYDINQAFIQNVNSTPKLVAVVGGKQRPWFNYLVSQDLLNDVTDIDQRVSNLPTTYKKTAQNPKEPRITDLSGKEDQASKDNRTPQARIDSLISDYMSGIEIASGASGLAKLKERFEGYYAQLTKAGKEYITSRGTKIKDYFNDDGTLKTFKNIYGNHTPTTRTYTKAELEQIEQEQRAARKALQQEIAKERKEAMADALRRYDNKKATSIREQQVGEEIEDSNSKPNPQEDETIASFTKMSDDTREDGMFMRTDNNTPIRGSLPLGQIKLLVKTYASKFQIKPKTHVYANVDDLRVRNPELYEKAKAARKQGDFDIIRAAGYSFGDTIIIFSDSIRTQQQLGQVLAHEILGHFGFKGVMTRNQFEAVMAKAYASDYRIRSYVARKQEMTGMGRAEAIEEYLAEYAAILDASMLSRVWGALKNALNKLGVKFHDDVARQLIFQTRRYVRTGTGGAYSATDIAQNAFEMAQDGRYAEATIDDLGSGSAWLRHQSFIRTAGDNGGMAGALNQLRNKDFTRVVGGWQGLQKLLARGLQQIQTVDNMALQSEGLGTVLSFLRAQTKKSHVYMSRYNQMLNFSHSVGVTGKQLGEAGDWLIKAALARRSKLTDAYLKSFGSLVKVDEFGTITIDEDEKKKILAAGEVTIDDFKNGLEFVNSAGQTVTFKADIDPNSNEWKIFTEQRNALNQAALDMMLANYEASQYETQRVVNKIAATKGANSHVFSAQDTQAIKRIAEMYHRLAVEKATVEGTSINTTNAARAKADRFLIATTRVMLGDNAAGDKKLQDWINNNAEEDVKEFEGAEYDDIRSTLADLNKMQVPLSKLYAIQNAIRELHMFTMQSADSDLYAKYSILGAYAPIRRRGDYAIRLTAYDSNGNIVKLHPDVEGIMPYYMQDSQADASDIQLQLAESLSYDPEQTNADGSPALRTWKLMDDNGDMVDVNLIAEVGSSRKLPDIADTVNFNEFVYVLARLNIDLKPAERQRIVTSLTKQNEKARTRLQATGNPGYDPNVFRSVAEHLETTAHAAAKKIYRHRIADTLLNKNLWFGDDQKLRDLKRAVDQALTPQQKAVAQKEYERYAHMYMYMKNQGHTVEINGKKVETLGRGEDTRGEALKLIKFQQERLNVADSTEEFLSNEYGAAMRTLAVIMQLGGSIATGLVNTLSLPTHALTFLSEHNHKTGFGGGYGWARSAKELAHAFNQMKNPSMANAATLNKIVEDGTWAQYGLTEQEARFMQDETEGGMLMAAAADAMLGTARAKWFSGNKTTAAVKTWMWFFNYTEQLNRRTTALAAYRLEYARQKAAGKSDVDADYAARQQADTAVHTSQGDYSAANRPAMARGNVLQYTFMYKTFTILTVQLFRHLPPRGKLALVGMLLLMAGLKGLPFADDIFDLINTLCQIMGWKVGDVEAATMRFFDDLIPGFGQYAMRGGLDNLTGGTISSRTGHGNLLPFTGSFKAGADHWREFLEFAGPVTGNIGAIAGTAGQLGKYGLEAVGLREGNTSMESILRNFPAAAVRSISDIVAYHDDGAITNARGKIISRDVGMSTYIARFLGFYPTQATHANDIIRMSETARNYALQVRAEFTGAYVKAGLDKDRGAMRDVVRQVREWNSGAKGTGLELNNFNITANRALRDARLPLTSKYRKYAPEGTREYMDYLMRMYGVEAK